LNNRLASSLVWVPAVDIEEAVLDAFREQATVDPKRWSGLLGPRSQQANRQIQFSAIGLGGERIREIQILAQTGETYASLSTWG
jgi:hypothetical protein